MGLGGNFTPPLLCWFSLNNSEMAKAVTLVFCSIYYHFIKDICANSGIPNLPQSPDIGQNSHGGISNFWISGQSLIKVNCHNSWTTDDINMKLGPVTKLEKRNKTKSLKMTSYPQIVTSLSFFRFMSNLEQSGSRIPEA